MMNQPQLSLHHLTALSLSPVALIKVAHQLGCSHVGLFTGLPAGIATAFPYVDDASLESVSQTLREYGIGLNQAEVFGLKEGIDLQDYLPSLRRAASLGARCVTTHIHEPDKDRMSSQLARFIDLAAPLGLNVALECTSFSACRRITQALELCAALDHPALCLAVDALHFNRNENTLFELSQAPAHWLGYVQLCDGPKTAPLDLYAEAVTHRLIPGEGEFELVALLKAINGPVMVDVEVPHPALPAHLVYPHAAKAVVATQKIMRQANWC